ncbi:hypothetical protein BC830DRAFT_745654 [Chytriomyces sp. MP71]|nr:hypothetical protein BC830DRAFT_745654 [Chytriomyces sp. MP71]
MTQARHLTSSPGSSWSSGAMLELIAPNSLLLRALWRSSETETDANLRCLSRSLSGCDCPPSSAAIRCIHTGVNLSRVRSPSPNPVPIPSKAALFCSTPELLSPSSLSVLLSRLCRRRSFPLEFPLLELPLRPRRVLRRDEGPVYTGIPIFFVSKNLPLLPSKAPSIFFSFFAYRILPTTFPSLIPSLRKLNNNFVSAPVQSSSLDARIRGPSLLA